MADLIDRQAAIKLLRGKCVAKYPNTFIMGLLAAADEINKLPSVDAVEVVRGEVAPDIMVQPKEVASDIMMRPIEEG